MERARQNVLEVGLIAHLHFRQNDCFPENAAAFNSELLPVWPMDASSRTPGKIGYCVADNKLSAIIWCAGYNRKDDGGVIDTNPNEDIHDVGYTLVIHH